MKICVNFFLLTALLGFTELYAQEHSEEEHKEFKNHRISITLSHTHVPRGIDNDGSSGSLIIPSWGLNYEYWFNHNWAIGMHNDMEITSYVITERNDVILERERPFIVSIVGIYKFNSGLEILTGFGYELEKHENFMVFRLGVEYEFELGKEWDLAPGIVFDAKEDIYSSYTLGLTVGKRF